MAEEGSGSGGAEGSEFLRISGLRVEEVGGTTQAGRVGRGDLVDRSGAVLIGYRELRELQRRTPAPA